MWNTCLFFLQNIWPWTGFFGELILWKPFFCQTKTNIFIFWIRIFSYILAVGSWANISKVILFEPLLPLPKRFRRLFFVLFVIFVHQFWHWRLRFWLFYLFCWFKFDNSLFLWQKTLNLFAFLDYCFQLLFFHVLISICYDLFQVSFYIRVKSFVHHFNQQLVPLFSYVFVESFTFSIENVAFFIPFQNRRIFHEIRSY